MRVVRDKAMELHAAVRKWTGPHPAEPAVHRPALRLRPGQAQETTPAKKLVEDARKAMEVPIPIAQESEDSSRRCRLRSCQNFLFKAFKYRVDQVLAGKPHTGAAVAGTGRRNSTTSHKQGAVPGRPNNPVQAGRVRHQPDARAIPDHRAAREHSTLTPTGRKTQDPLQEGTGRPPRAPRPGTARGARSASSQGRRAGKPTREVQFFVLHEALPLGPRSGGSVHRRTASTGARRARRLAGTEHARAARDRQEAGRTARASHGSGRPLRSPRPRQDSSWTSSRI